MNRRTILGLAAAFIAAIVIFSAFKGETGRAGSEWQTAIKWTEPSISGEQIAAQGKPVFLFVSTEWCTFCRKMKAETFTDSRVREILNDNFVNIHMNPETEGVARFTGTEYGYAELARNLGVSGYPALFFFSSSGELIGGQPGYLPADQFADLSEYIGGGYYRDYKFSEYMDMTPDRRGR